MSIWIIERVYVLNSPVPLAIVPLTDERMALAEIDKLRKMYGGDYRAVEYRRVELETITVGGIA